MQGGGISDIVGNSWENYISKIMNETHWHKVFQGIKIKRNGKTLTDIDILALKDDLLVIIQIKIYYGSGINTFEQWKFRKKLEQAVRQVKLSEQAITSNMSLLSNYFDKNELKEIRNILPLVMTNSHIFNGWKHDGVPIMSVGSLMQFIKGGTVKFQNNEGKVLGEKAYRKSTQFTVEEFIKFVEMPLDWRIGNLTFKVVYHTEEFEHAGLKFPMLLSSE